MLRLDRVGAIVVVPLAIDFDAAELQDRPQVLRVLQEQAERYAGASVRVRLLNRDRVLAIADEQQKVQIEAALGVVQTVEGAQAKRALLRRHVEEMVAGLPGVEIGGVDLADGVEPKALAQMVDEAHLMSLLPDVAIRALSAQSPSRATKNRSASSPSPSGDASSSSGA